MLGGIAVGYAVSSSLRSLLYGVAPGDPVLTAATATLLLVVAFLAAWVPARSDAHGYAGVPARGVE